MILSGQTQAGAYIASPTFPPYAYSWLRDGSFIADAMSRSGEVESAEAFFDWVTRIVETGRGFEARYTLEGERDPSEWPQSQPDGWGLWLWAVRKHCERHPRPNRWRAAAAETERHLRSVRNEPCIDWWEEREACTPRHSPASPQACAKSSTLQGRSSGSMRPSSCSHSSASTQFTWSRSSAPAEVSTVTSTTATTAVASGSC